MLFIAADCRAQEREGASGSSVMRRTSKKFSERAAVVLRLHSIGCHSVAVVSNVPQGGVVEIPSSIGNSSAGNSAVQAAAEAESTAFFGEDVAEGVNADDATEHTEDEEVAAMAVSDPLTFAAKVAEAVIAPHLDTDES
jgi:hypothetical protein